LDYIDRLLKQLIAGGKVHPEGMYAMWKCCFYHILQEIQKPSLFLSASMLAYFSLSLLPLNVPLLGVINWYSKYYGL